MNIQELDAKVDQLQTALDSEQEQIKTAIDGLTAEVANLNAIIADGGTPEQRQAIADKIDSIVTDLKGTIPDVVVEPPVE